MKKYLAVPDSLTKQEPDSNAHVMLRGLETLLTMLAIVGDTEDDPEKLRRASLRAIETMKEWGKLETFAKQVELLQVHMAIRLVDQLFTECEKYMLATGDWTKPTIDECMAYEENRNAALRGAAREGAA